LHPGKKRRMAVKGSRKGNEVGGRQRVRGCEGERGMRDTIQLEATDKWMKAAVEPTNNLAYSAISR
jgi:hypothetical protein